jgi:hypothetical protein
MSKEDEEYDVENPYEDDVWWDMAELPYKKIICRNPKLTCAKGAAHISIGMALCATQAS